MELLLKYKQKLSTTTAQFIFILFPKAVTNWEEVPASLLVHIPDIRFLPSVFCIWLINQMHQEKPANHISYSKYLDCNSAEMIFLNCNNIIPKFTASSYGHRPVKDFDHHTFVIPFHSRSAIAYFLSTRK